MQLPSIKPDTINVISGALSIETKKSQSVFTICKAILIGMRPKQAIKNLFVFAALVFSGQLTNPFKAPHNFLYASAAFFLFSLVAGGVYLMNDILDVENDKAHPEKCKRPIAAGDLPIPIAWACFFFFSIGSVVASFVLDKNFGVVALAYFLLQLGYNFYLKHEVLLDVFTIAIGFVLRTSAGGLVIHVPVSPWLLLCTLQLALFLGFGKRRQELIKLGDKAAEHRKILQEYSLPFLEQMINIVAGITIVCYSVYTIESDTSKTHPHLWITIPFVLYGVCRYLYLVYQKGEGGAPEDALRKDRMLQLAIICWFVSVVLLFLYDKPGLLGLEYQKPLNIP